MRLKSVAELETKWRGRPWYHKPSGSPGEPRHLQDDLNLRLRRALSWLGRAEKEYTGRDFDASLVTATTESSRWRALSSALRIKAGRRFEPLSSAKANLDDVRAPVRGRRTPHRRGCPTTRRALDTRRLSERPDHLTSRQASYPAASLRWCPTRSTGWTVPAVLRRAGRAAVLPGGVDAQIGALGLASSLRLPFLADRSREVPCLGRSLQCP